MKYAIIACACAVLLGSSGCKKEGPVPASHVPALTEIFGEWQWVSSVGGLTGKQVETPPAGSEYTYQFDRDSSFVECHNGQCSVPGKFSLRMEKSLLFGDQRLTLVLRRNTGSVVERTRYLVEEILDELRINDDSPDGFGNRYVRKGAHLNQ